MGVTKLQFSTLEELFDFYNKNLFENKLPSCLVNLSRHREAMGFYIHKEWKESGGKRAKIKDEISINPDTLNLGDEYWHSTLVHEMCHMWQFHFGKPSRYSYHNQQWANKMIAVGLMPSDSGRVGGKKTGQQMSDYPIKDGKFQKLFQSIAKDAMNNLKIPYIKNQRYFVKPEEDNNEAAQLDSPMGGSIKGMYFINERPRPIANSNSSKSGVKVKYSCDCGYNVWGKSGLNISCDDCEQSYREQ